MRLTWRSGMPTVPEPARRPYCSLLTKQYCGSAAARPPPRVGGPAAPARLVLPPSICLATIALTPAAARSRLLLGDIPTAGNTARASPSRARRRSGPHRFAYAILGFIRGPRNRRPARLSNRRLEDDRPAVRPAVGGRCRPRAVPLSDYRRSGGTKVFPGCQLSAIVVDQRRDDPAKAVGMPRVERRIVTDGMMLSGSRASRSPHPGDWAITSRT